MKGFLSKMPVQPSSIAQYQLPVGSDRIGLNALLGKKIKIEYLGSITCQGCRKSIPKSYSGGYCFPCCRRLAQCDLCIMKPELCHWHKGTCREPAWGEEHCMADHILYLANTSGIKVGLTRYSQMPTRWLDQGATQALPILRTKSRRIAGLIEVKVAEQFADKTNWRAMLKGDAPDTDLEVARDLALQGATSALKSIQEEFGEDAFEKLNAETQSFRYPVNAWPEKVKSIGLDKMPVIEDTLTGIKGQYLYFGDAVFNVRKHNGYEVEVSI